MIALAALALIGVATLSQHGGGRSPPWCLSCALRNPALAADLIGNVALFVPLGIGLRLAGFRLPVVLVAALAASLCVEVLQAYVVAGRVASLADVATNTLGAVLGAAMAPRLRALLFPTARTAVRLAAIALSGFAAILAASAWALQPAYPRGPAVVRGVVTRAARGRPEHVVRALANGRAIHNGDTVRSLGARAEPLSVQLAVQVSPMRWDLGQTIRFVAERRRFLQLGIERDTLTLDVRRRGATLRLASPALRVSRPMGVIASQGTESADTIFVHAVVAPWRMSLAVRAAAASDAAEFRLHPLAGWSVLVSTPRSSRVTDLLTVLWTALLILPVAYWSAAATAGQSRLVLGAVLVLSLGVVWGIGAAVGAPAPPWTAITTLVVTSLAAFRLGRGVGASTGYRVRLRGPGN